MAEKAKSIPYRMQRVRVARVDVLGKIWMPAMMAGTRYDLSDRDLENIGEFTRENLEKWLGTHAGDFQEVKDFSAVCGETEINWSSEDNQLEFQDYMYPTPD